MSALNLANCSLKNVRIKSAAWAILFIVVSATLAYSPDVIPYSIAFTKQSENCLPGRVALLEKITPAIINQDDLVIFKPFGVLAYLKEPWVVKVVKGVPGDLLEISDGQIWVNGQLQDADFIAAPLFQKNTRDYDKKETIPSGKYFVMGTHPYSIDSRYWGYLDQSQIKGKAHIIL